LLKFIFPVVMILAWAYTLVSCNNERNQDYSRSGNEIDLSSLDWKLWIDSLAAWQDDTLYLPPVDIGLIKESPPGCGWEELYSRGINIHVPATVEEYLWNDDRDNNRMEGDYRGVSWFCTSIPIPEQYRGKRVILAFESVRLRAEVYVNEMLAGYDVIGNTPFTVDITKFIQAGEKNQLAVRITDPSGNFDWGDYHLDRWGKKYIPPSHGFGGITGRVSLYALDSVSIHKVFIMNKPDITSVDISIEMQNLTGKNTSGELTTRIYKSRSVRCLMKDKKIIEINDTASFFKIPVTLEEAEAWSPENPNLYRIEMEWKGIDGSQDSREERFGFRWFEVRNDSGDRQFYLNGKRIFLLSAISWGFWPGNGIFPQHDMEIKQVKNARQLGLNMLNFHRAIGDPMTFKAADEEGLLIYEEPGGYRCPDDNVWFWDLSGDSNTISHDEIKLAWEWRRIKLMRMIERDRNHPSLVIYSLQNEILHDPDSVNTRDMLAAHQLDPTRFITYSSNSFEPPFMQGDYVGVCPETPSKAKMYMEPYSSDLKYMGWWDQHFAPGPGCYIDNRHYENPGNYYHHTDHKEEIIFYGEDGAIGSPSRVSLIRKTLASGEVQHGWDGSFYLAFADALEKYLDTHGFTRQGVSMDDYILSMGNVAYYYQGRIIENCRINNLVDGYVINGWENSRVSNFSGMVDIYRNLKGDPGLLSPYNQPAYVAVKLRNKVLPSGKETQADIYAVNQSNFQGSCRLLIQVTDQSSLISTYDTTVNLIGGNTYGQLLAEGIAVKSVPPDYCGYIKVNAQITQSDNFVLEGSDELFMVHIGKDQPLTGEVYDESLTLIKYLKYHYKLKEYNGGIPEGKLLVLGAITSPVLDEGLVNWIRNGNTLLIVHDADRWMQHLHQLGAVPANARMNLDSMWFGGHFFVKDHALFRDLPVNTAFNWEYQVLARYSANRYGLLIHGGESVAGTITREDPEIGTAVGIIPCGKGEIIFSTLDILPNLHSEEAASVVARKILLNYLVYASH